MSWVFLIVAILTEVAATLSLRAAASGRRAWYVVVVSGYVVSFVLLARALAEGMGIGVAYGIWTAVGVALTAVLSKVLFGEPLTRMMVGGIALIIAGVLLLETGGH
ncbi:MAG TPA: SMR family transporter [Nocardioides sp.]|uniref:DMT family transporter n=1 Tax=uncultured Nocardioides sp. TaxID=198441 RepID=UPI000EE7EF99|nr:SMR family transporter [uncultured Nocardioides sp.]HCB07544.1 QacE family quaternary ammonium compound efflux SMR transporter [Nocardioides sp.]HRD60882.1 SMR family transporter [Nocardioides sp.]HRI94741.1 SMR family transporter [Nocardioides sp.]HRK44605.1 SMR family transporter [Nocardioides sp.]